MAAGSTPLLEDKASLGDLGIDCTYKKKHQDLTKKFKWKFDNCVVLLLIISPFNTAHVLYNNNY